MELIQRGNCDNWAIIEPSRAISYILADEALSPGRADKKSSLEKYIYLALNTRVTRASIIFLNIYLLIFLIHCTKLYILALVSCLIFCGYMLNTTYSHKSPFEGGLIWHIWKTFKTCIIVFWDYNIWLECVNIFDKFQIKIITFYSDYKKMFYYFYTLKKNLIRYIMIKLFL